MVELLIEGELHAHTYTHTHTNITNSCVGELAQCPLDNDAGAVYM